MGNRPGSSPGDRTTCTKSELFYIIKRDGFVLSFVLAINALFPGVVVKTSEWVAVVLALCFMQRVKRARIKWNVRTERA